MNIENENNNQNLSYSEEFLKELTEREKEVIQTRKIVSNILLTIGCQFTSSALALIMLQFSIDLLLISLINWISIFIPLIPEASNISINFENGFRITGIKKPGIVIFKMGCGAIMSTIIFHTITSAKNETSENIKASLVEVKQFENPPMLTHTKPALVGGIGLLVALTLIAIVGSFVRRHQV